MSDQANETQQPLWDDDAIVEILRRRQHHHLKLPNGWSVITLIAAAELMRMVRDDLLAAIAERDARIEQLESQLAPAQPHSAGVPETVRQFVRDTIAKDREVYINLIPTTFISPARAAEIDKFDAALAWLDAQRPGARGEGD